MHRPTTSLANVSVTETDLIHNRNGRLFSMHVMSFGHKNFTSINIFACEYFGVCQISIDWPFLQIDHFDIYIKFTDLIPFNSLIFYIDNITVLLFFTIKKRYHFLTHFWAHRLQLQIHMFLTGFQTIQNRKRKYTEKFFITCP